ncbi:unnamed protein product, partial [Meganyctiphanes norvegica]
SVEMEVSLNLVVFIFALASTGLAFVVVEDEALLQGVINADQKDSNDVSYTEDTISNSENKVSVKEVHESENELVRKPVDDVVCPGGGYVCPGAATCCPNRAGSWSCCPHPWATCCGDGIHCCPHGYWCVAGICQRARNSKQPPWGTPSGYTTSNVKGDGEPQVILLS